MTSDKNLLSCQSIIWKKAGCLDEVIAEYMALSDPNKDMNTLFCLLGDIHDEFYLTSHTTKKTEE